MQNSEIILNVKLLSDEFDTKNLTLELVKNFLNDANIIIFIKSFKNSDVLHCYSMCLNAKTRYAMSRWLIHLYNSIK